jgi:small subunit ribosomal protein S16
MSVRIRLNRTGSKKQPSYRIVVIDKRRARNGKYIEVIGHYNPRTQPSTEVVKEDRALYWMSVGAQPSEAVVSIFNRTGTNERFARFRSQDATIEELAQEALANPVELPSPRTNYPAPAAGESKIKAREAARLAAEEAAQAAEGGDEADSE